MLQTRELSAQVSGPPAPASVELCERANRLSARHSSVFLTIEAALKTVRDTLGAQGDPPLSIGRDNVHLTQDGSCWPIIGHRITLTDARGRLLEIRSVSDRAIEFGHDGHLGIAVLTENGFHSWKSHASAVPAAFETRQVLSTVQHWLRESA